MLMNEARGRVRIVDVQIEPQFGKLAALREFHPSRAVNHCGAPRRWRPPVPA
jgi:hypothetical protein